MRSDVTAEGEGAASLVERSLLALLGDDLKASVLRGNGLPEVLDVNLYDRVAATLRPDEVVVWAVELALRRDELVTDVAAEARGLRVSVLARLDFCGLGHEGDMV